MSPSEFEDYAESWSETMIASTWISSAKTLTKILSGNFPITPFPFPSRAKILIKTLYSDSNSTYRSSSYYPTISNVSILDLTLTSFPCVSEPPQ